jgi:FkbM family methyltransferase
LNYLKQFLEKLKSMGYIGLALMFVYRFTKVKIWIANMLGISVLKSRYGVLLAMNYGDRTFEYYVGGIYGNYYWDRISKINTEFIYMDIGANAGLYTICAARNPKNLMSYAFEPVPDSFNFLEKNISLNGLASKCSLVKKAISTSCSLEEVSFNANHSGAASLLRNNKNLNLDVNSRFEIETIDGAKLDSLVQQKNIPIVIKIDVEGYELIVIQQLIKTSFVEVVKEIFYEIDEDWTNPKEIENLLRSVGFNVFKKIGSGSHYDILALR